MLQSLFRAVLGEDAKWLQGLDLRFKILVLDPFGGAKMLPLDEKSSTKKNPTAVYSEDNNFP